jgi:4-amino-4-deoxy-L-arabinose transferase-like glycosyltransferase
LADIGLLSAQGARRPPRGLVQRAWDGLDVPGTAVAITIAYTIFRYLLQCVLNPNQWLDLARLTLLAQDWRFSYDLRHPALLVWIARALLDVTGSNGGVLAALLFALLALTLVAYAALARWLLGSERMASLAVLILIGSPVFWFNLELSFSYLLWCITVVSVWLFVQACECGRRSDYLLLSIALAVGLWTKYIFALQAACFALAVLLAPEIRRKVLSREVLAAMVLAIIAFIPAAVAVLRWHYSMIGLAEDVTEGNGHFSLSGAMRAGGMALLYEAAFALPFAGIWLFADPGGLKRGRAIAPGEGSAWARVFLLTALTGNIVMAVSAAALNGHVFIFYWLFWS